MILKINIFKLCRSSKTYFISHVASLMACIVYFIFRNWLELKFVYRSRVNKKKVKIVFTLTISLSLSLSLDMLTLETWRLKISIFMCLFWRRFDNFSTFHALKPFVFITKLLKKPHKPLSLLRNESAWQEMENFHQPRRGKN